MTLGPPVQAANCDSLPSPIAFSHLMDCSRAPRSGCYSLARAQGSLRGTVPAGSSRLKAQSAPRVLLSEVESLASVSPPFRFTLGEKSVQASPHLLMKIRNPWKTEFPSDP